MSLYSTLKGDRVMAQQQLTKQAPLQSNHEQEEAVRHRAIDLFIAGQKPSQICRELGRSRPWFYKTLDRYRAGGRAGLASRSRAPKRVHNRTPDEVEAATIRVRQTILSGDDVELRYASMGADTIAAELKRAGIHPPPPPHDQSHSATSPPHRTQNDPCQERQYPRGLPLALPDPAQ